MKRLTTALVGAILLVTLTAGVALAAMYEQAASSNVYACDNLIASSAGPNVCFGETSISGRPGGDLFLLTNGSDVADFSNIIYGLVGEGGSNSRCDGSWLNDWNDCLTDAVVKLPAGTCFRAYTDEGYGGARVFALSNRADDPGSVTKVHHFATATGSLNNAISSARLYSC